jgi:hypothetical protein
MSDAQPLLERFDLGAGLARAQDERDAGALDPLERVQGRPELIRHRI